MTTQTMPVTRDEGTRVGWRGWAALAVLMLPVLLVSVDNTVLSFALPSASYITGTALPVDGGLTTG